MGLSCTWSSYHPTDMRPIAILVSIGIMLGLGIAHNLWADDLSTVTSQTAAQIFGKDDSDHPIATGWVFLAEGYIQPPYHVARDGLTITINGVAAHATDGWPPYVPAEVNVDPGAAPPGSDPLGPPPTGQPNYWFLKERYLMTHFLPKEAQEKYMQTLKDSGFFTSIVADADDPTKIEVVDKQGEKTSIMMFKEPPATPVTQEMINEMREEAIAEFKKCSTALAQGSAIWQSQHDGHLGFLDAVKTKKVLSIITSGQSDSEMASASAPVFDRPSALGSAMIPMLSSLMKCGHDSHLRDRLHAQSTP